MSRVMTASKLVAAVRQRAMIPTDTSVYSDEAILNILNEEMDAGLLSTLLVLNDEHLVCSEDYNFVSGQSKYAIPYRSIGNKLRDVSMVNSEEGVYELSRVSLDQLSDYKNGSISAERNVFYVQGNHIVLVDSVGGFSSKIRMHFYLRPNVIVAEKRAGVITAINRVTGVVSLSNFPEQFSNLPEMDFVGKRSPNKIYDYDKQPLAVDGNTRTVTFNASDIPSELIVGDYLCIKEESPVPNIPTELHPLLTQRAAVHILEALGDTEGLSNAKVKLNQMELSINNLIDDRVEGAPQKIKPRYSTLQETNSLQRFRRSRGRF